MVRFTLPVPVQCCVAIQEELVQEITNEKKRKKATFINNLLFLKNIPEFERAREGEIIFPVKNYKNRNAASRKGIYFHKTMEDEKFFMGSYYAGTK